MYRSNVPELADACAAAIANAKLELLTVVLEVQYTKSDNATIAGLAAQVNAPTTACCTHAWII